MLLYFLFRPNNKYSQIITNLPMIILSSSDCPTLFIPQDNYILLPSTIINTSARPTVILDANAVIHNSMLNRFGNDLQFF